VLIFLPARHRDDAGLDSAGLDSAGPAAVSAETAELVPQSI
jgi:hypothetical protein